MVSLVPFRFTSADGGFFNQGRLLESSKWPYDSQHGLGICFLTITIQITWLNSSLVDNYERWNTIQSANCHYDQLLHFLLVSHVEPHQRLSRSFRLTFPGPLLQSRVLFSFSLPLFNMSSEMGKGKPDLRNALKNPDITRTVVCHAVNHLRRLQRPKHLRQLVFEATVSTLCKSGVECMVTLRVFTHMLALDFWYNAKP